MESENRRFRVRFQPSLQDYESFARLHERVGKGAINRVNRISNIILRVFAVLMSVCAVVFIVLERRVSFHGGASILLALFCICYWIFGKKLTARLMRKQNEKLSADTEIVVDDEGVRIHSAQAESTFAFEAVESIYLWRDCWFFYVDAVHAQMLPFRCFVEGDPAEFGEYLSEKTGLPVQTPSDKKKERQQ